MDEREKLQNLILKKHEELSKLKERLENLPVELTPIHKLAIALHSKLCNGNHTDACGWLYEVSRNKVHNWNGYAHDQYLKRANNLKATCPNQSIEEILNIVENL